MLHLDDRVWILWALWILLIPAPWLLGAVAAACVHELCHIGAVCFFSGKVRRIAIGPFGAKIHAEGISGIQEAVCALAGPAGSFLCVGLIRIFPVFSLCALVQGLFNLLPVYPMDGGRALSCLITAYRRKKP